MRSAPIAPAQAAQPASTPVEPRAEAPRVATPPRWRRSRNPNCRIRRPASISKSLRKPISPPPRANSSPRSRRPRRLRRSRHAPSAKFWSPTPRRRALRSNRICRRIIRSSRARDRPRGWLRRPSASPPRRARSAKFHGAEKARQHLELHRRRAPRRPGRRRAAGQREGRARGKQGCGKGQGQPSRRTARSRRPSPPRSARCWSAPAWS